VGQTLEVKIEQIDRSQRRISLSPVQGRKEENKAPIPEEGEDFSRYMRSAPSSSFGSLGDVLQDKLRHVKTGK
jgi:ribosomal protein S1